jgi:ferric-dicitrate binding protein FerR (iron transport regulator)
MYKLPSLARTVQILLVVLFAGSCLGNLHAQSHEAATAIEVEGQVSVVRGGQIALFQRGTPGVKADATRVNAKEEIVTGADGHAVFRIADGSTFEVFPNSRVIFQSKWTLEEMLELVLGRIRVQIEHRNGPNHKKVETPTAVISVRGTIFDVEVQDADGTTYVGVEEGQVQVEHALLRGTPKILNPNESITVYPNMPLAKASPGFNPYLLDSIKRAAADLVLNNPGGVLRGGNGGAVPGGPQGDNGKTKKNPPAGAPPAAPGGGGQ